MKYLRKLSISIILIGIAYVILTKLNILPNVMGWFASKPVLIQHTPVVIQNIRAMSELVTMATYDEAVIEFRATDEANMMNKLLRSNTVTKHLVLIAKGTVYAGVLLQAMPDSSIHVTQDSIHIQLPKATILEVKCNPSDTEIYIEEGNWTTVEINELKNKAKQKLLDNAIYNGILTKADTRAKQVMLSFLLGIGFKKVVVN